MDFFTMDMVINLKVVLIFACFAFVYGINLHYLKHKVMQAKELVENEKYDDAITIYEKLIKNEWLTWQYYGLILEIKIIQGDILPINEFIDTLPDKIRNHRKLREAIIHWKMILNYLFKGEVIDIKAISRMRIDNAPESNLFMICQAIHWIENKKHKKAESILLSLLNKVEEPTLKFTCCYLLILVYHDQMELRNKYFDQAKILNVSNNYLNLLLHLEGGR